MDSSTFTLTGDAELIRSSANEWSMFSTATLTAARNIRGIDSGGFAGDEADLFHQKLNGDLTPHLETTSQAWSVVAGALKTYATTLMGLQSRMSSLSGDAAHQQEQVDAASTEVVDARTADSRHADDVQAERQALPAGGSLPPDTYRSATAEASERLDAANAALQSNVDAANKLHAEHDAAVDACVASINRAAEMRFEEPPGFWGRLKDAVVGWIKDHVDILQAISSVLKQISSIAGILAMIPILAPVMGPIAMVSGAAALTIDSTVYAATGKGSLTDILVDGASMLPFAKGVTALKSVRAGTTAAKEAKAATAVVTDSRVVAGDTTDALADLRRSTSEPGPTVSVSKVADTTTPAGGRAADTATRPAGGRAADTARRPAGGRAADSPANATNTRTPVQNHTCVGDPIDVVSGEMVMLQTDLAMSGVLPLVLKRVHLSSYRWGSLFGPTWASTLDQRVEVGSDGGVCFVAEDGVVLYYPGATGLGAGECVLPTEGVQRWPLRRRADGSWTVEDPDSGVTRRFAEADAAGRGRLFDMTDRHHNTITVDYDRSGVVCGVRHSGGYRVEVVTADGLLRSLAVHNQGTVAEVCSFGYDEARNLLQVNNSAGEPLRFDCDDDGHITQWTDRNGIWYCYEYDEDGRCVRTSGRGRVLSYGFCYLPGRTLVTDSLGAISSYEFNDKRQVVRQVDALGHVTASVWDHYDRLLVRTDAVGRSSQYEYDGTGRLISVTHPDGSRELLQRNRLGLPELTVDATGAQWRRAYDDHGSLIAETDPSGNTIRYTRSQSGAITTVRDPEGNLTTVSTDAAGLPIRVIDPAGGETAFAYDGFGRLVMSMDPLNAVTTYEWAVDGRLVLRIAPDGSREEWTWDGEGNLISHSDAMGARTEFANGIFDLPVARTGPDGHRMTFGYDTELRLTSVQNPAGLRWRYEYDRAGRMVQESDFNGRTQVYDYDPIGRLIAVVNGIGQRTELTYDLAGNLAERRTPEGVTSFGYDALGRLVSAVSPGAVVHLDRDALGRVVRETVNGRSVESGFDASGRLISRTTPAGVGSSWAYNECGRPASLVIAGHAVSFSFDAAGREVGRQYSAGGRLEQSFDVADRLIRQVMTVDGSGVLGGAPGGAGALTARLFQYRADGALIGLSDELSGRTRRFVLDDFTRVTAVSAATWSESYAYDQSGNVAAFGADSQRFDGVGDREYAGTLVTRAGNVSYGYDAQGRMVSRSRRRLSSRPETWKYAYDALDRMVSARSGERLWTYSYDAFGRRISKQRLGADGAIAEQTLFTWSGDRLIEQVHADGSAGQSVLTSWEYLPGSWRPIGQCVGASAEELDFYAVVSDLVGMPTELVTPDGSRVAWRNGDSSLWGGPRTGGDGPRDLRAGGGAKNDEVLSKYVVDCPLRFPGQYADRETGLHYNRYRYYDPTSARYTTADPLGLLPADDPHSYVINPTGWADPLGLAPCGGAGGARPENELVYRSASGTPDSLTVRPGVDTGGLSTWRSPAGLRGRIQVIDASRLRLLRAIDDGPAGHVSIAPYDLSRIAEWASTRGTGIVHPFTQDILEAIVDTLRLAK